MGKRTPEENKAWNEVYEYMKEMLGYDETMKLPQFMTLRLIGLSKGKFMANKKQKAHAEYPFSTILIAMKISRASVNQYIARNNSKFKDEKHKFNGVMVIVEGEINDVVLRLKKVKKVEEKIEKVDMSYQERNTAQYKKTDKKENKKLDDIW